MNFATLSNVSPIASSRPVQHGHFAAPDVVDRRVPAQDHHRQKTIGQRNRRTVTCRYGEEEMAFEMIDRNQRNAEGVAEPCAPATPTSSAR
jgi:hypothetical protein